MDCSEARALVDACLDNELELTKQVAFEDHLAGCRGCTQVFEVRRGTRTALGGGDLYFRAPARLQRTIRKTIRPSRFAFAAATSWPVLAAAAALVLFAVAGTVLVPALLRSRPAASDPIAQQVVSSHVRSLQPGHLTDVASSDQHTVKPWFAGRLDYSPPVIDLSEQGFPLVGGRLDSVDGRTVAALVYQRRLHTVNVFVWPSTDQPGQQTSHLQGFNLVRWSHRGFTDWAVSDLGAVELEQFVRELQRRTP